MKYEKGAGRPSTAIITETIHQDQEMVVVNLWVIIDEVAWSLRISHGFPYQRNHDDLSFHKESERIEACQRLIYRYNNEGEKFLSRIGTGDETWVQYYEPESKRQPMEWKHDGSLATKKLKLNLRWEGWRHPDFLTFEGPTLEDYMEKGFTIQFKRGLRYNVLLANNLNPTILTKRRRAVSKNVLLLHDNARSNTAGQTVATINQLCFEVLEPPV